MSKQTLLSTTEISQFRSDLLDWYSLHARDLPWRNSDDPYHVWVSEIMLQQTRVAQAQPYFLRFLEAFPSVRHLATAELDEVLLLWEGLGYYSRARNLHRAARQIVNRFGSRFPTEEKDARQLAGVGPYTAAAVLSIAYGRPVAAIDGNVTRVLARYFAIEDPIDRSAAKREVSAAATALIDPDAPGAFNQAMMDLGATVCMPSNPSCNSCPLSIGCRARKRGLETSLPVSGSARSVPHYDVAVGVIPNANGEILLTKRPEDALLGGLWEFPGAKCRDGETLENALRRGVSERVGIDVEPESEILSVRHAFSHFKITMHAFSCQTVDSGGVAESPQPYRWIDRADMRSVALHRAARKIADHIEP